ncbi:baculoviral iap repeat-containing protein 6 [Chrysochromulina tobinii]|uniref:Baculoviral iap repeat-containing protein 6 n=1 Tax=Chrysochromulina tobinii TaxID=1460289 RepID=A0A0M0JBV9_9EUKA|nr:baculoviral iap repeat-containing protein 6 [Chrysochromulina tobinii]|eukprot:KOO24061.1 baculoviral iap repeat-containing protein 6 [Chrysochromulina sp. CCMP291]
MRQPPRAEALSADECKKLQQVFGLSSPVADGGDKLHRSVSDRQHSWAFGDDRSLTYLLSCFRKLVALDPAALAAPERDCFAKAVLLHHARTMLLSGEAHDDGLALFETQGDSELNKLSAAAHAGAPHAANFLHVIHASMTDAEVDQAKDDWRIVLKEVESLLGVASGGAGAAKPLPQGAAVRSSLARRMVEETVQLRCGRWSARDAEVQGCLRLFSPAPPGFRPASNAGTVHHDDLPTLEQIQGDVTAMQTQLRQLLTAAFLKDNDSKVAFLEWIAAVITACELALPPPNADPRRALATRPSDACVINLSVVLLQLCEPFLDNGSTERTGKGHDGMTRFDAKWFDRELERRATNPKAQAAHRAHRCRRMLEETPATAPPSAAAPSGSSADVTMAEPGVAAAVRPAEAVTTAEAKKLEFHFVTECFFLAMGALHVGIYPALDTAQRLADTLHRKLPPLPPNAPHSAFQEGLAALRAAGPALLGAQGQLLAYRLLAEAPPLITLMGKFVGLTAAWIVDTLYVLVSLDEHHDKHSRGRGGMLGGAQLLDLVDARAAEALQPPMLSLYVELGLHTNSEAVTDKNSQRYLLMKVLRRLWQNPSNWATFVRVAAAANDAPSSAAGEGALPGAAKGGSAAASASSADAAAVERQVSGAAADADHTWFGEFATTLVKENLFLLDDALGRLADVKKREAEKADEAAWNAQPAHLRRDREARLDSVRRTAKSFLDLGKASLSALLLLTSEPLVGTAFTHVPQRAHKMAGMLLEFLRRLSGPDTAALNVTNREKLGWYPRQLLSDTMVLLLQCKQLADHFVDELREADAYDLSVLERAHRLLADKCQAEFPPTRLDQLGRLLGQLRAATAASTVAVESAADLLKRVDAQYVETLRPLAYEQVDMENAAHTAFEHYYKANIADCPADAIAKSKIQRLMRELRKLSGGGGEGALPIAAEAAIFARVDESRTDVLKVLISGPADLHDRSRETPYALGLFEFHIFVPNDYPQVPPLVNLQTTGDGMVRFNPNLYSDGKVCLSLLGTWHGEGWTPPSGSNMGSTLLQVLVSIQSIIMVSKPYFNEPGYADEEGTPAGEQRSREYNEHIRLAAMRHAMRDMLRRPPRGFEEVVRRHFVLNRPLLERQCAAWLGECVAPQNRVAMEKAYVEIVELIEARVHELFAQNVALGQERNAAAAAALQQAQAEQGSLASSPGTASSKDVEMA